MEMNKEIEKLIWGGKGGVGGGGVREWEKVMEQINTGREKDINIEDLKHCTGIKCSIRGAGLLLSSKDAFGIIHCTIGHRSICNKKCRSLIVICLFFNLQCLRQESYIHSFYLC